MHCVHFNGRPAGGVYFLPIGHVDYSTIFYSYLAIDLSNHLLIHDEFNLEALVSFLWFCCHA